MRLHLFIEEEINKLNQEQKCGYCWKFYAPLTEDALNKQQLRKEDCNCVHVMLTRDNIIAFGNEYRYNEKIGRNTDNISYKSFKLFFLKSQQLDVNNHIEILNHSTEKSKITFLEDLEECISKLEFDLCNYLGTNWVLSKWQGTQLINYRDYNYTGFRIDVTLKKRLTNERRR